MFATILVPVDGSKRSEEVALKAFELAKLAKSKITLMHVVPTLTESFKDEAGKILNELSRKGRKMGVEVETLVEEGDPKKVILKVAQNSRTHLIVMGTKRIRGFTRILVGSVASYVITHAGCDVLVVKSY
jgi:nucleotide-binding universal stress UspA family protein